MASVLPIFVVRWSWAAGNPTSWVSWVDGCPISIGPMVLTDKFDEDFIRTKALDRDLIIAVEALLRHGGRGRPTATAQNGWPPKIGFPEPSPRMYRIWRSESPPGHWPLAIAGRLKGTCIVAVWPCISLHFLHEECWFCCLLEIFPQLQRSDTNGYWYGHRLY